MGKKGHSLRFEGVLAALSLAVVLPLWAQPYAEVADALFAIDGWQGDVARVEGRQLSPYHTEGFAFRLRVNGSEIPADRGLWRPEVLERSGISGAWRVTTRLVPVRGKRAALMEVVLANESSGTSSVDVDCTGSGPSEVGGYPETEFAVRVSGTTGSRLRFDDVPAGGRRTFFVGIALGAKDEAALLVDRILEAPSAVCHNSVLVWRRRVCELFERVPAFECDDVEAKRRYCRSLLPLLRSDSLRGGSLQEILRDAADAQNVIFGLFGIDSQDDSSVRIRPDLPEGWDRMSLRNVRISGREFDVFCSRKDGIQVRRDALRVRFWEEDRRVPLGGTVTLADAQGAAKHDEPIDHEARLRANPPQHEWEDPSRLSEGKLPPRTWFGSFPDVESAKAILSSKSPRRLCLDSEEDWHFLWSRRPSERPADFFRPDYDVSGWDVVRVPCSWQAMGIRKSGERFGTPIFVNQPYIFTPPYPENRACWPRVTGNDLPKDWTFGSEDNPVGSYRRDFEVPADWIGDVMILQFDGVESFFRLWVNGGYVGFSKNSRSPAAFDVTHLIRSGTNTVSVEVYRNSDGSYLECQDIFRLSGIIRSVGLTHRPKTHLKDVRFSTHPVRAGDYEGDWEVRLETEVSGVGEVMATVFDDTGATVGFRREAGTLVFAKPKLWSAEEPNLYTLVVSVERDGRCVDAAGFQLGFREVEIRDAADQRDRTFLFNGKAIKLKGVNRGECDPEYGHHVPDSRLEEDIRLVKRGNFNHIRNSHMPQPELFYYLCNKYGIYVMDEANIESHGLYYGVDSLSHVKAWEKAHLDRQQAMCGWNRNFPCVVIWSMGNEAGPGDNFKVCYDWLKASDPTRPVQYERNNWLTDMGSRQYPTVQWVWDCAAGEPSLLDFTRGKEGLPTRYPYHINEYAHNFNNNCGNLADFQEAIESSDRIMGGAIWDWADQTLWTLYRGRRVSAWGGCFGEKPEEGQGINDGIVTADRRPEPSYYEAKHVFQNFSARFADALLLKNKNYFRDSSFCRIEYAVLENGVKTSAGELAGVLAPQEERAFPLPTAARDALARADAEVALRVSFVLKSAEGLLPAGWIMAEDQVELSGPVAACRPSGAGAEIVRDDAEHLEIVSGNIRYGFSRSTGELISILKGGREWLRCPMTLDCFRVPVGGETFYRESRFHSGRHRLLDGLRTMKPSRVRFGRVETAVDGALVVRIAADYRGVRSEDMPGFGHGNETVIEDKGALPADAPGVETVTEWRFDGDGRVGLRTSFRPFGRAVEFQRLGWRLVFDEPDADIRYFARGPFDNYSDRCTATFPAVYFSKSTEFGFRYTCGQDNGNREEARFVELSGPGLSFLAASRPFAFGVSPYSPTETIAAVHPELLPAPSKTELGLYARVRGLGSANCGPQPLIRDRISAGETCELDLVLSPSRQVCSHDLEQTNPKSHNKSHTTKENANE